MSDTNLANWYIRQPQVVEAVRIHESNIGWVLQWMRSGDRRFKNARLEHVGDVTVVVIPTPIGPVYACPGDWVVRFAREYEVWDDTEFQAYFMEVDPS